MSNFLRFAHKSFLVFILLVLVSTGIGPHTASAQVNARMEKTSFILPPPDQPAAPANAIALDTNLIRDPSFEASYGTNNGPWHQSPLDTICIWWDPSCDIPDLVGYHSNGAWALLGRGPSTFHGVSQPVRFPKCGARLQFHLYMGQRTDGFGLDHRFAAVIDDTVVFEAFGSQVNLYRPYQRLSVPVKEFADGNVHTVWFFSETDGLDFMYFNVDDVSLYPTVPPLSNCAKVAVTIKGASLGTYGIPQNEGDRQSYRVNDGPVFLTSTRNFIASQRVISSRGTQRSHFSELMGFPQNLASNRYSFPVYDNIAFNSQLRFANIGSSTATVRLYIAGREKTSGCTADGARSNSPYSLPAGKSLRVRCPGISDGPVVVESTGGNIVAAARVVPNSSNISYSEMMGLPQSQVTTSYIFPWYDNSSLNTQLRIGNVSNSPATVRLYIGGREMTSGCVVDGRPSNSPYTVLSRASLRVRCTGVNDGPVRIVSDVNIVASERVAFFNGNTGLSFSEFMGFPATQLNAIHVLPWYNNADLNTQLRVANVSNSPATVRLYIAGREMTSGCTVNGTRSNSPYQIAGGKTLLVSCAGVNNGPVKIVSNTSIVVSERVIVESGGSVTNFSELMGLPIHQLTTNYILPWYNNIDLNTQLRFAVP